MVGAHKSSPLVKIHEDVCFLPKLHCIISAIYQANLLYLFLKYNKFSVELREPGGCSGQELRRN